MSDTGSVFSRGGGGINFEQYIQTAFLTSMIVKGNIPGIPNSNIVEIGLQATRLGYKTDDLFIRCVSPMGEHKLLAQIKHEFSFTVKDPTFKDIITQLWQDFNNTILFNQELDRLLIIKENLNKTEANDIKSLINWAKSKNSESDFILEINRIKKKVDTLEIFRVVIEEINEGRKVTDKEIWTFFKCLEILSYDFGNHSSTHLSYFLNLIRLTKSTESTLSENEIWALLYEFISLRNKDGGLFSLDSISKEAFYYHFKIDNLKPFYNSLNKLDKDSDLILNQLSNEIHGFHLERFSLKQQISESINNSFFTIVTGKPGVGKSAIIRDVLNEEFPTSKLIVLRADQLNNPNLSSVLVNLGIKESLQDILSCISTFPQKILFIDSLEKLLEGDSENAFKQLYNTVIKYPDIKIIAASRKYAVDLLILKYGINKSSSNTVEVPSLNEDELSSIKNTFPQLERIFTNEKIKKLLESPKYIDYTLSLMLKDGSDYSKISLIDFKTKLWNHIVENETNRKAGLPGKRGKVFSYIAIERAKKMCLFVEPNDSDYEVIYQLENDNIIYRNGDKDQYSPAHDILEDWALIKYIDTKRGQFLDSKDFFVQIGTEPAIRRAFRLWVEEKLTDDIVGIIEFVKRSIDDDSIEKFWADEILIAIFKSEDCKSFFIELEEALLENSCKFLIRCIHIIRTTCKESGLSGTELLCPIGSGWHYIIKFISEHLDVLDPIRPLIINVLLDWECKIYINADLPEESKYIRNIISYYLNQIENQEEFWVSRSSDNKYVNILRIYLNIISIASDDILLLIDRALNYNQEDKNWRLRDFYKKLIEICLSGVYSRKIVKEIPDKICEIAWKSWKYEAPANNDPFGDRSTIDVNVDFGLKDYLDDSPAGIYKTPFWNLLWVHPYKAFDFIIDFTNYCCESYSKSKFVKSDKIIEIEIKINDEKVIKQKGSLTLWQAYRGTGRLVPDVLRSVLISLEKYLLTLASYENETSRKLVKHCFYYLLEGSNNVAITSVLSSLCIAYPKELEECLLPILGVKEFYNWDMSRASSEYVALDPMDFKIPFAQKEMFDHNQLPHRKEYRRGLVDFVTHYQINIRTLNSEIHKIFDGFLKNLDVEDIIWKKFLSEMDVRTWELGEYNQEMGGFIVQPKYEDDVKEFVDSNKQQFDDDNLAATHSVWSSKKLKNEDNVQQEFENWQNAYIYLNPKEKSGFYDKPGTLAYIGLRDYQGQLSQEQKEWCLRILIETISRIQSNSLQRYSLNLPEYNIMDVEPCLRSFSLIFKYIQLEKKTEYEIAILLFYCLISPIARHEKKYLIEDFRDNMWEYNPRIAERIWNLLIDYAAFKKLNYYYYDDPDTEMIGKMRIKEHDFISNQISNAKQNETSNPFNFETHVGQYLVLGFLVLPYSDKNPKHQDYIKSFLLIYFDAALSDNDHYENLRNIHIQFEDQTELMRHLSKYFLLQKSLTSIELLGTILDKYNLFIEKAFKGAEMQKFIKETLKYSICELDYIVCGINDYKGFSKKEVIDNFWILWDFLHRKINESGDLAFSSVLFLEISSFGITWNENFKDWEPLDGREDYYKQIILEKGYANVTSILNIFVSVGHTRLLPQGLSWLVNVLKQNQDNLIELVSLKGERFIEDLFHYYCTIIKGNKILLENYIWLLNNMIDLGSSLAYLIRENVITYKSN